MHRICSGVLLAALALGAVACTGVDAAPPPPPPPAAQSVAAIEIAARLTAPAADRVPHLHDLEIDDAAAAARTAGATLRVVVMGEDMQVTAQYPSPGDPLPDDTTITVWRGTPPSPPAIGASSPPSDREPTHPPRSSGADEAPPPAAEPLSASSAPVPHPPRTNPGRLPEAEVGLTMTGLASWYGEEFAGRTTACGTVFDPGALTLASRELRCGTTVRITGPNGSTVEAVATDWGPAEWTGRRFDLSAATFAAIHHPGAGVVTVTVEVLPG